MPPKTNSKSDTPDDPTVDNVASRTKARHASRMDAPESAPAPQADPMAAADNLNPSGGDQTGADNAPNIADSSVPDGDSGGNNAPVLDAEASHERIAAKLAEWYASLAVGSDERRDADAHFAELGIQISEPSAGDSVLSGSGVVGSTSAGLIQSDDDSDDDSRCVRLAVWRTTSRLQRPRLIQTTRSSRLQRARSSRTSCAQSSRCKASEAGDRVRLVEVARRTSGCIFATTRVDTCARQEAGPKGLAQPSTMRALPSKRPKLGRP